MKTTFISVFIIFFLQYSFSQKAIIAVSGEDSVAIIDINTNTIIKKLYSGDAPYGVCLSKNGKFAYVTHSNFSNGPLITIDLTTNTIVNSINTSSSSQGVCLNPSGTKAYVATGSNNSVQIIDLLSNTIESNIIGGSYPKALITNFDGSRLYVANEAGFGNSTVSVIDTKLKTIIATIGVGSEPKGIAITKDGSKLYVNNLLSNYVSVINTATNTVTDSIPVGVKPEYIALSPDETKLYVANWSGSVSIINTSTNTVSNMVTLGNGCWGISVSRDGQKVYVNNSNSNTISILNTNTLTVTDLIVGTNPYTIGNFMNYYPNNTPKATDDTINLISGDSIIFNPLTNDIDIDGDSLIIYKTSNSINGDCSILNSKKQLKYKSSSAYVGLDSILYTIYDTYSDSSEAKIYFKINKYIQGITNNIEENNQINIFPNPIKDKLNIHSKLNIQDLNYKIYDINSVQIKTGNLNSQNTILNLDNLKPGIYYISISSKDKILKYQKIGKD